MISSSVPRLAFRQSRLAVQRRAASSTTEAATNAASTGAAKAKEGASQAASQAQQGLSRVQSSAGSAVNSASNAASQAASNVGGRAGRAVSFVQGMLRGWRKDRLSKLIAIELGMIPPTLYYARVVGELGKMIYRGRGMQPP